jgi:hypothetical protein
VLLQQHLDHPARRDEPDKATVLVDDGQRALAVADGLPGGHLLVGAGGDHRGVRIHEDPHRRLGGGGDDVLDASQADQGAGRAHRDVGGRLEAPAQDPDPGLGRRRVRLDHGHRAVR